MKNQIFAKLSVVVLLLSGLSMLAIQVDAQPKKDRKRAEQLVRSAEKAYLQKNFRVAVDDYSAADKIVQITPQSRYKKAFAHYYLKEIDLAIAEFEMALTKGYKPPVEIYKVRWQLHSEKKNYDAAAEDIQRVLKAEPNNTDFILALADVSMAKGAYQEAADAYQKAILRSPNNGNLFYQLALARSKLGDFAGQASAAEEAVKKNTQYLAQSYVLIADARVVQKRYPEAIAAYERALKSKPDLDGAHLNLADLYRRENRINDAIEISKAGLREFPKNGKIFTDITWYYSLAGRTEDAIEAGRAATRLLPQEPLGYTNLCRAYNEGGKPEMAITTCNTALRLNPNDGETNFYLGRAYALLQKPLEADKYYKRAVTGLIEFTKNYPDYSDGFYLLGNAYAEDGQSAKAIEAYRKCLELSPRFAKAQFNIGIIQIGQKNKAGAIEQYNSLLNTDKVLAGKLKAEIDKL